MIITLQRSRPKAPGYPTLGRLTGSNIDLRTLEDPYVMNPDHPAVGRGIGINWPWTGVKIPGVTAIPAGRYRIYVTMSPRFHRPLPLIVDVHGFTGIRIHRGKAAEHSEGCVIVGRSVVHERELDGEVFAENLLVDALKSGSEEHWIDVKNWIDEDLHAV